MTTATQILAAWQDLNYRERAAVFEAIARDRKFPEAVREVAAEQVAFPSYREALRAAFGASADRIPGPDVSTYPEPVMPLRLAVGEDGRPFISCGGEVVGAFDTVSRSCRATYYLVRNDDEGLHWDASRPAFSQKPSQEWTADEVRAYHTGRPAAQYLVVLSI